MKRAVTLKENYEFRRLYQKGASAVGGGMVLYCRKNRLGHNRLGVTVSVKLGHAVVRNRARRRLREVYRLNSGRLRQGYDMILVARGRTSSLSSCISIICCLLFSFSFLISDIAARMIPVLRTRRKRRAGLPSLA